MQNHRSHVADEVRAGMARKRMTQADLAELLGVSRATVARRLSADSPFNTDELLAISDALDIAYANFWPLPEEVA